MPLTSNPDAFYLSSETFFDKFGFEKPSPSSPSSPSTITSTSTSTSPYSPTAKKREANSGLNSDAGVDSAEVNSGAGGEGHGVDEVVFYCKAGIRSRAAARMAREWAGVRVGDMRGGWLEWEERGGDVER